MKIYLDNCCYNRPFDEQRQIRVSLETQAKLHIQEQIKNEKIELAISFISRFENKENPDAISSISIADFFQRATTYIGAENFNDILGKASKLMKANIKMKDATHLACAIKAECVCNPITFLQLTGGLYA
ncbi:MAG: hypothetical protein LBB36_05030 [Fibromonadaceae bacterium]|jgi:hypothetical protein|nr:hypothetical protein [Fibromonadaceae bacterium]